MTAWWEPGWGWSDETGSVGVAGKKGPAPAQAGFRTSHFRAVFALPGGGGIWSVQWWIRERVRG